MVIHRIKNTILDLFKYAVSCLIIRLIVGAPRSKLASVEEPGLVYRYDLQLATAQLMRVQPLDLSDEKGFIESVNHHVLIKKNYGWFGASMAIEPNENRLTVRN